MTLPRLCADVMEFLSPSSEGVLTVQLLRSHRSADMASSVILYPLDNNFIFMCECVGMYY